MRRVLAMAAIVALVSAVPSVGLWAASSAGATPTSVTCLHGSGKTKVSPGLTTTAARQTVKSSGTTSDCDNGVTGTKTKTVLVSGPATCATLALGTGTLSGTESIKWSGSVKGKSTATITITGEGPSNPSAVTGTITAGPFAGSSISTTIKSTPAPFKTTSPECSKKNALKKATYVNESPIVVE
jgi:hypothetical protein